MHAPRQPFGYSSFSSAIDEPQTAQSVQHCQNVEVAEGMPQLHVRLEVVLSEHDGNARNPGHDAEGPSYESEIVENYWRAGHLEIF